MFLNVQKWVLSTVSEKENVYSVYFHVFQNIEINKNVLQNDRVKSYFIHKSEGFP